jgi:hypothetical protein
VFRLLVIGYWLLVIGYWLLVIGYWLLVIGYSQSQGSSLDLAEAEPPSNCHCIGEPSVTANTFQALPGWKLVGCPRSCGGGTNRLLLPTST